MPPEKRTGFWSWVAARRRWAILLLPAMLILGAAFGSTSATLAGRTVDLTSTGTDESPGPSSSRDIALDAANARVDQLEGFLAEAEAELEALADLDAELAAREEAVAEREAAADAADAARLANSFGDGVFLVGVDIVPGTYRTEGGTSCYWERLAGVSGSFDDVIANDNVDGPSVVAIAASDVAFSSGDCGTWNLVG